MRRALYADAFVAICDLRYVSCYPKDSGINFADFVIVNPVILANRINAIIASKIGSTNGEMVHFDVSPELEDEVELGTIDQDEIVEA